MLTLDVASDGGVDRGAIVVVENFRLRRTMATLLGIEMDDREHPLTLGTQLSGNSVIGGAERLAQFTQIGAVAEQCESGYWRHMAATRPIMLRSASPRFLPRRSSLR